MLFGNKRYIEVIQGYIGQEQFLEIVQLLVELDVQIVTKNPVF